MRQSSRVHLMHSLSPPAKETEAADGSAREHARSALDLLAHIHLSKVIMAASDSLGCDATMVASAACVVNCTCSRHNM